MIDRVLWEHQVAGSNPVAPISYSSQHQLKITDATNGLEMQLTVTDIGYGITFTNGEPVFFGSMPFKPVFTTF